MSLSHLSNQTFLPCLSVLILSLSVAACSGDKREFSTEPETPLAESVVQPAPVTPTSEVESLAISEQLLDTYRQTCGNCHEQGIIGAPKTGDTAAWKPRMAQSMETLVLHARNGFKAMPPAGLCYSCSDEDFAALIQYMATEK